MNVSIISVTENGRILSQKIYDCFSDRYSMERFCFHKNSDESAALFFDINSITEDAFFNSKVIIFVCACGIAVRSIAPYIKSKAVDPAVLVIDDKGSFVIPILSGHLGGANEFAKMVAEKIGAVAVITTATDIGGKFSPDSFAKANNLIINDLIAAKETAAAVLNNEKIGLESDYECKNIPLDFSTLKKCRVGICISADNLKNPFEVTLNLVPRNIVIGVGCKKGTACEVIEKQVSESLSAVGIDINRVFAVTTIDIKADEKGLLEFCEKYGIKLFTYTAEELMGINGNFTKSDFVLSKTGTDNVCERSVVKHRGKLIMPKKSGNGVTVAAGEMSVSLDFAKEIL